MDPPAEGRIGEDLLGDPIHFVIPEGARSITVVVEGHPGALFAISSMVLADGVERAGLEDPRVLGERPGMPIAFGPQRQVPAFGELAFQYPYVRSQPVSPGPATLRVASDTRDAAYSVAIYMPVGEARTLHVSLVSMASLRVRDVEPAFVERARSILAPAGIELVVDERVDLDPVTVLSARPPASPTDRAGLLVDVAHEALSTHALPIVLVDLAEGHGFSRGIPCPPDARLGAHAVFVDPTPDLSGDLEASLGRILAHEVAHALGLLHVEDFLPGGERFVDPFEDTNAFDETLMGSMLIGAPIPEAALTLTLEQRFAMTRSALLD